jgi:hypothetical protein
MPGNQTSSNRPIWLAIIVITALIVAAAAGFALHLAKATPAVTLAGSGAAFTATMTLSMAASRFLTG